MKYQIADRATLHTGDCLEVLKGMADNSVDSVVTDPPYGLSDHKPADVVACMTAWLAGEPYKTRKKGFMAATWDSWVPGPEVWREVYRVLKPGGHVVAFAGSRTHDLMSIALRLAGFQNRDTAMWIYGSGFPKSMDVSKAIDKAAGAEREVVGTKVGLPGYSLVEDKGRNTYGAGGRSSAVECAITAPATDAARQWQGWGTALKPAFEPALLFRKPLEGTVAANVLKHGTGALNIDGCRVPMNGAADEAGYRGKCASVVGLDSNRNGNAYGDWSGPREDSASALGRFPANLIHDGSDEVLALFPDSNGSGGSVPQVKITGYGSGVVGTGQSEYLGGPRTKFNSGSGSAARFFYCPKASKKDRNEGLDASPDRILARSCQAQAEAARGNVVESASGAFNKARATKNNHPTVKPTDLCRYLVRLVTPPDGVTLDPFCGSGSSGKAAMLEGFRYIGIDSDEDHIEIARARTEHAYLSTLDDLI